MTFRDLVVWSAGCCHGIPFVYNFRWGHIWQVRQEVEDMNQVSFSHVVYDVWIYFCPGCNGSKADKLSTDCWCESLSLITRRQSGA
jgi:hypothetical protein